MAHTTAATPRPTRWGLAALFGLIGALVVALVVMAFVWPTATAQAQNLPVGISGPDEAVAAVEDVLAEQDPSPFALAAVDSRDDAVQQIETRTLYGAILLGDEPEVLIASAASPAAAQALRGIATQLQIKIDGTVNEALYRSADRHRPGASIRPGARSCRRARAAPSPEVPTVDRHRCRAARRRRPDRRRHRRLALPTRPRRDARRDPPDPARPGRRPAARRACRVRPRGRRAHHARHADVVRHPAGRLAAQCGRRRDERDGDGRLHHRHGGPHRPSRNRRRRSVTMLIANPIAAAAIPVQFLPEPWGAVGQWFVPGASANLLRSTSYFPEAATAAQWLILGAWIVGGVVARTHRASPQRRGAHARAGAARAGRRARPSTGRLTRSGDTAATQSRRTARSPHDAPE